MDSPLERDLMSGLWDTIGEKFSLIFPFNRFTSIYTIYRLSLEALAITGLIYSYLRHLSGKSKFNSPRLHQMDIGRTPIISKAASPW